MRPVVYMCHPVAGDVDGNIKRAMRWLVWLRRSFPDTTFIAPWISDIMSGQDDSDPKQREAGLVDCCATVKLCAGIVLVGGRISSGMLRESGNARATCDLTHLGDEPPEQIYAHDLQLRSVHW